MTENDIREQMVVHGRSLFERRYTCGGSGNMSARLTDGVLVTPTNSCLGRLERDRISKLDGDGKLISGDPPSKEWALHLAVYRARPNAGAVVHLHSTHAVAVSVLADADPADVLPALTAYYAMRIGTLPLLPYFAPGDPALTDAVGRVASRHHAVLLANHGPVVSGASLAAAADAIEELEATAKLWLLVRHDRVRTLEPGQVAELRRRHPR